VLSAVDYQSGSGLSFFRQSGGWDGRHSMKLL
jgi:hypothetical protein